MEKQVNSLQLLPLPRIFYLIFGLIVEVAHAIACRKLVVDDFLLKSDGRRKGNTLYRQSSSKNELMKNLTQRTVEKNKVIHHEFLMLHNFKYSSFLF